jgi:hypothetical protein
VSEIRTAREIAEYIILDHAKDVEWLSINEMTEDEFEALGEEAHEALCREVDDLIRAAAITVTFPEETTDGG